MPAFKPAVEAKRSELAEVRGRIAELASDQSGSRFLQQKYEFALPEDKQMIFRGDTGEQFGADC